MTSTRFFDSLTPLGHPLPTKLMYRIFGVFFDIPSPILCGRHKLKPPFSLLGSVVSVSNVRTSSSSTSVMRGIIAYLILRQWRALFAYKVPSCL